MQPSATTWISGSLAVVMTIFNTICNGLVALILHGTTPTIRTLAFTALSINLVAVTSTGFFVVVRAQLMSRASVFCKIGTYRRTAAASIIANSVAHTLSVVVLIWIAIRVKVISSRVIHPSFRTLIVVWFAILGAAIISQLAFYSHVMLSAIRAPVFQIISPNDHSGSPSLFRPFIGCPEMVEAGQGLAAEEAPSGPLIASHAPSSLRLPTQQLRVSGASATENALEEAVTTAFRFHDMQPNQPAERPSQNHEEELSKRYGLHDALRMTWNTESRSPKSETSDEGSSYTGEAGSSDVSEERIAYAVEIRKTSGHRRLRSGAPSPSSCIGCGGDLMVKRQSRPMIGAIDKLSMIQSPRSTLWGTATVTSFSPSTFRHTVSTSPSSPAYPNFHHPFFQLESPLRGTIKSVKNSRRQTSTSSTITQPTAKLSSPRNTKHYGLPPDIDATVQSNLVDDPSAAYKILSGLKISHLFGPRDPQEDQDEDEDAAPTTDRIQVSTKDQDLEALRRAQDIFGVQASLLRMLAGQENAMKGFQ